MENLARYSTAELATSYFELQTVARNPENYFWDSDKLVAAMSAIKAELESRPDAKDYM